MEVIARLGRTSLAKCAVNDEVVSLAETLKVISDVNRLRMLCVLFNGEKCVCEIEDGLGISQPLASHHLKVLLKAGLVEVRREATWSYYSLNQQAIRVLNESFKEFLGAERIPENYAASVSCCKEG